MEEQWLQHKQHHHEYDPDYHHRVHPPKAGIGKPIPQIGAPGHPEAARACEQDPYFGLPCETIFQSVKGGQTLVGTRLAPDCRHRHHRHESHPANPQKDAGDVNNARYCKIIHIFVFFAAWRDNSHNTASFLLI